MTKIKPKPSRPDSKSGFETGTQKANTGNGGLTVTHETMGCANKVPCIECPLRRTSAPGYLGGYTPEMYLDIMFSPASIACHMSPGFRTGEISKQKHCTGVAAFRANVGFIAGMHGIASHAHGSTKEVGHDEDEFFASPQEFVAHHGPAQKGSK